MARLKGLEDENRRLMYAEERLKAKIVQEALQKKVVKPSCQREMAQQAVAQQGTRPTGLFGIRYQPSLLPLPGKAVSRQY